MSVQPVTEQDFEDEVLASDLPVLIDFHADWCGPCKSIAPIVEALSVEHAGAVKFVKVDVDHNPRIAQALGIQSIPTLVLIHQGQLVDRINGAVPRSRIEQALARVAPKGGRGSGAGEASVESWDPRKSAQALSGRTAVAVDVREELDYRRAHLPAALNVPAGQLESRLSEFGDRRLRYLFYSRTSEGLKDALAPLAAKGIRAAVLDGGLLAWESESLPIERTRV